MECLYQNVGYRKLEVRVLVNDKYFFIVPKYIHVVD